jgi:hypothetical protein
MREALALVPEENTVMQDTFYGSINNFTVEEYQEKCRIYMDEVEEWDYLPLFDNTFVMDRFMRRE